MRANPLSHEYIRGLVEGEGCFTFCTGGYFKNKYGKIVKRRIPTFSIQMHERDEYLLGLMRDSLGLTNSVYNYQQSRKDGFNRGRQAVLRVREFKQLRDVIVPLFYKKLRGNKGVQFSQWIERIGTDPDVPPLFKEIHNLYKEGFYDRGSDYRN